MLRRREVFVLLILVLGALSVEGTWWGFKEEGPNDKVAKEIEESLEQRKDWSKHLKEGVRDEALKALAHKKARILREATTPEEKDAAHQDLESFLAPANGETYNKQDVMVHLVTSVLNSGVPGEEYLEWTRKQKNKMSPREAIAHLQRMRSQKHDIEEQQRWQHNY